MSELTNRLRAYGADMDGAMARFIQDENLYAKCFRMFLADPSFAELGDALSKKDYTAAFNAAHTLKGVAGNLGLTPLYNTVCDMVEPLRRQDYSHLDAQYQAVLDAKDAV